MTDLRICPDCHKKFICRGCDVDNNCVCDSCYKNVYHQVPAEECNMKEVDNPSFIRGDVNV